MSWPPWSTILTGRSDGPCRDHPAAGVEVRRAICRSTDEVLRRLLAERPGLDEETNATLAADASPEVRAGLAAHTDDPDLLAESIRDPDPKVRVGAARNPHLTPDHLRLLVDDRIAAVRMVTMESDRLPHDALPRLAHDRSIQVRLWLAALPTTPEAVLRILAEDPHPDVAGQARAAVRHQSRGAINSSTSTSANP
ncbi:hypothetical protein ACTMTF_33835 [Nonomuraea sp. ZG12]|uniref:hypothetical protein n=1 Tax=Nonomuraea sp. ZG12 TaxID=3452207 RepID=UPI003F8A97D6